MTDAPKIAYAQDLDDAADYLKKWKPLYYKVIQRGIASGKIIVVDQHTLQPVPYTLEPLGGTTA